MTFSCLNNISQQSHQSRGLSRSAFCKIPARYFCKRPRRMRSAIKLRSYSATAPRMRDQQLLMRIATGGLIQKLD